MEKTLWDWANEYVDTPEMNNTIIKEFTNGTNSIQEIKAHRDFIENAQNKFGIILGHGDRSLQYLWKLLVDEMPKEFNFLEIGVYKGQILSLIELLSEMSERKPKIVGITPLYDKPFGDYDRLPFIKKIYEKFNLNLSNTTIFDGLSQNTEIMKKAKFLATYDMIYIDGDHSYNATVSDIKNYSKMIKNKGFLIIDDCCNYKNHATGVFRGLLDVSNAVKDTVEYDSEFKELVTCMHVRIWQRVKNLDEVSGDDFWNQI